MSRPLRIEFAGALYHITSRGNRQEAIYLDAADRHAWLALLGDVCERHHWVCYAYCQMTNHYHLLIATPEGNLSKGMRQLNGVYTQLFNRHHRRVGHVFQGRYKAILVDEANYLLEVSRYVVLNPVRAGLVEAAGEWPWSSYRATIGKVHCPAWLHIKELLSHFGQARRHRVNAYITFVRDGQGKPACWENLKQQIYLGDERFVNRVQQLHSRQDTSSEVPLTQRRSPVKSLAAIAAQAAHTHQAMAQAYQTGHYSLKEIGCFFGVHYSTVSRAVKHWEKIRS